MRRALALVLLLSGCSADKPKLEAMLAGIEKDMQRRQELVELHAVKPGELEAQEKKLAEAVAALPESDPRRSELARHAPAPPRYVGVVLPAGHFYDSASVRELRSQIEATNLAAATLDFVTWKPIADIARKAEIEQELRALEAAP